MNQKETMTMRDALIGRVYERMRENDRIFFLSADMGAPVLDRLRADFRDRFINVGIAEQNLVNVATGLALEGYVVYGYAIAPFLMRPYEQIRVNLALSSQFRDINVNLLGVGAGVSYDVSGPTHHCFEDLSIMRTLPNMAVCAPSDWVVADRFVDYSLAVNRPKYVRLDGKPQPRIYGEAAKIDFGRGFCELVSGNRLCLVTTGFMTQLAIQILAELGDPSVGLIDLFLLKPFDEDGLANTIRKYRAVATLEEAFIGKGGLDSLVMGLLNGHDISIPMKNFGFRDEYVFKFGSRDFLYGQSGFDRKTLTEWIAGTKKGEGA
jgi:transketolase